MDKSGAVLEVIENRYICADHASPWVLGHSNEGEIARSGEVLVEQLTCRVQERHPIQETQLTKQCMTPWRVMEEYSEAHRRLAHVVSVTCVVLATSVDDEVQVLTSVLKEFWPRLRNAFAHVQSLGNIASRDRCAGSSVSRRTVLGVD